MILGWGWKRHVFFVLKISAAALFPRWGKFFETENDGGRINEFLGRNCGAMWAQSVGFGQSRHGNPWLHPWPLRFQFVRMCRQIRPLVQGGWSIKWDLPHVGSTMSGRWQLWRFAAATWCFQQGPGTGRWFQLNSYDQKACGTMSSTIHALKWEKPHQFPGANMRKLQTIMVLSKLVLPLLFLLPLTFLYLSLRRSLHFGSGSRKGNGKKTRIEAISSTDSH